MSRILFSLFVLSSLLESINFGQGITTGLNSNDCLELFYINSYDNLCYREQLLPGEEWSDETVYLDTAYAVYLVKNPDHSLELFYINHNKELYRAKKDPSGNGWLSGSQFGEDIVSAYIIPDNSDLLHMFCLLEDGSATYRRQLDTEGVWSDEQFFLAFANILSAGCNADGRLEVFYTIESDIFMHRWQLSPGGDWADPALFSDPARAIEVGTNADGRLEVFFIGTDNLLHHKWQVAPSSGWEDDALFSGETHMVKVANNADGRMEILFTNKDDILFHNWQTAPSNGWGIQQQFGWYASDLAIAKNKDQCLEVIYSGTDGLLYHRYQLQPNMFWSSEYPILSKRDPLFSFGEYNDQPSFTNNPKWHINDHCFIQSEEGTWHMFGIMYPDPGSGDMSHVNYFGHASAEHLLQIPWTEEEPPFYETLSPGDVLWAPHIVEHDGIYYMFYCGGGENTSFKICLTTSDDLITWSERQVLFTDGYQARDPMVLYVEEIQKWVMYYCATEFSVGGNFVVFCKTSEDLYHWDEKQIVYRDLHTGTGYGPTESPFVVNRGDYYYLFIGPRPYDHPTETLENWEHPGYCGTDVFRSTVWNNWTNADFVGWFDAHAPEIVHDGEGHWYASHCGVLQGGLYIRQMNWLDGINPVHHSVYSKGDNKLLQEVVPNPFYEETIIYYTLDRECAVQINIIDINGKRITGLIDKKLVPGDYSLTWNGTNFNGDSVPSGIYFCVLTVEDHQEIMKLQYIGH